MAIEFRCSTCNKLLRTPDEAAGKSARCPQCGTVVDVPSAAGADDPFGGSDPFAPDSTEQPAAEPEPAPFVDPSNPYAVSSPVQDPIKAAVTGGEFHHQQVDFDDLFSTPWSILKMNIGPIAICGLFMLAFNMAVGIVNQVLGMVMPPVVQSLEGDTFSIVMTVIMFQLGMNALSLVVQTWVQLGATNYLLQMMRTGRAQVGDYFSVGPCYLRAFLFQIVIMLITIGISLVCMAPAAIIFFATGGLSGFQDDPAPTIIAAIVGVIPYIFLAFWILFRYYLVYAFLLDRNLSLGEAMAQSAHFMRGNKLVVFGASIVWGALFFATCCGLGVGVIWFMPFMVVVSLCCYMKATGQAINVQAASIG